MRFTVRILGAEVLHLSNEADDDEQGPGDCTTQPIGFVASAGDQRWEKGTEH